MPIREYNCSSCGRNYEILQKGLTPKPIDCECGETLEARISAPSVVTGKKSEGLLPDIDVHQEGNVLVTGKKIEEQSINCSECGPIAVFGLYQVISKQNLN